MSASEETLHDQRVILLKTNDKHANTAGTFATFTARVKAFRLHPSWSPRRHRGCKNRAIPTYRRAWWLKKLEGNAARDRVHQHSLRKLDWRSTVVWECQIEKPKWMQKL